MSWNKTLKSSLHKKNYIFLIFHTSDQWYNTNVQLKYILFSDFGGSWVRVVPINIVLTPIKADVGLVSLGGRGLDLYV